MITKLKSGFTWGYDENNHMVEITTPASKDLAPIAVPRVKARSLLCFLNRVAWHKDVKSKK